ncbi:hypothetical protein O6H91_07G098100 [Diphasiastrum complanatum]|uniref:Uncharacterized protein n=1 Tax=Diphasiastrum complanatum TaxID=34168 RepID=A0ACC2D8U9_DIPCM|nr:hypothetical protein O6H91_07G098100 [Diphasiastrum complanatum]
MNCLNIVKLVDLTDDCSSKNEGSYARSPKCLRHKDDSISSESGWTAYLEQSVTESFLKIGHQGMIPRIVSDISHGLSHRQGTIVTDHEDPSIASDASSGPQFPVCCHDSEQQLEKHMVDENILEDEELRPFCGHDPWESTRSSESMSAVPPRMQSEEGKRRKKRCQQQRQLTKHIQELDAVEDRLAALQQLIPYCEELGQEELLVVATEYVKSLERIVHNFLKLNHDYAFEGKSGGLEIAHQVTALQDKGLCLMPLSMLICHTRF